MRGRVGRGRDRGRVGEGGREREVGRGGEWGRERERAGRRGEWGREGGRESGGGREGEWGREGGRVGGREEGEWGREGGRESGGGEGGRESGEGGGGRSGGGREGEGWRMESGGGEGGRRVGEGGREEGEGGREKWGEGGIEGRGGREGEGGVGGGREGEWGREGGRVGEGGIEGEWGGRIGKREQTIFLEDRKGGKRRRGEEMRGGRRGGEERREEERKGKEGGGEERRGGRRGEEREEERRGGAERRGEERRGEELAIQNEMMITKSLSSLIRNHIMIRGRMDQASTPHSYPLSSLIRNHIKPLLLTATQSDQGPYVSSLYSLQPASLIRSHIKPPLLTATQTDQEPYQASTPHSYPLSSLIRNHIQPLLLTATQSDQGPYVSSLYSSQLPSLIRNHMYPASTPHSQPMDREVGVGPISLITLQMDREVGVVPMIPDQPYRWTGRKTLLDIYKPSVYVLYYNSSPLLPSPHLIFSPLLPPPTPQGPKCPSGCRIQGLLDKADHSLLKKIVKIRQLLDQSRAKHRSADQASKQTYDYLKEKLTSNAERLRQRIVDIKIKIDRQLRILNALKTSIKEQVIDMQRLEVDIDIKLRSCKGSCKGYAEFSIEKESYMALDKQMDQLEAQSVHKYKSGLAEEQKQDFFPEVRTVKLTLENQGPSASSAATASKVPGTHFKPSTSGSSSSSGLSTGSGSGTKDGQRKTITELGGGGETRGDGVGDFFKGMGGFGGGVGNLGGGDFATTGHQTTQTSSCTKTMTKTITGGTGGSFGGDPFGMDLGAFLRGNEEDDVPDFHARSVKTSVRSERQADYVGKDCSDIQRNHLTGEKSGLYKINLSPPSPNGAVEVYCDQEGLLGGWTLVQQRTHGEVSFNRSWADYQKGFGRVDGQGKGEVWLGLKHLHLLTREESMLRVELEDWEGGVATAEYTVKVGSEADAYQLTVAEYTGDAGDALVKGESSLGSQGSPGVGLGSFLSHQGMKFSTFDKDNDRWEESCAEMYGGGWWYNNCQSANLNGVYYKGGKYDPGRNVPYEIENGVVWLTYKPADYSLKTTRMKIRPLAMV
ncbi:unnamed protein product [Coregonus sp. 'balchen']|nr:unnamed protein product [Coregonus sp. 'balchen']